MSDHPRDFVGYGPQPVDPKWPNGARIALQLSVNYEGGGERSVLDGDDGSEDVLTDMGAARVIGGRSLPVESSFEYGSRRGIWRLMRMFDDRGIKVSFLAVARALERNPELARRVAANGHEIVNHGWRWIDYSGVPEETERDHVRLSTDALARLTGQRPLGCFLGRASLNSRRLLAEAGYLYDQDAFNDELPYWVEVKGAPHLVLPYSLETNDNRFDGGRGFSIASDLFVYLKDAFDTLYQEGAQEPKMMTIGLHDRLIGRPGRAPGLSHFLDYVLKFDRVWIARGIDIARHWQAHHSPASREGSKSSL
jgi:allantoinase